MLYLRVAGVKTLNTATRFKYESTPCLFVAMSSMKQERYPVTEEMQEAFVVDVDFHVEPSIEELLPYAENEAVERNLKLEGFPPTTRYWASSYATSHGGNGRQTHGNATTSEEILDVCEKLAVDVPIITPGYNTLPDVQNVVMKNEIVRMYNDYILEEVASGDESLKVLPALPQWSPEASVEEIKRIGDNDSVVGFYGFFGHYRLLGHITYDPVFEELVKRDLPLALHGGGTGNWSQKDLIGDSLRTWSEMYGLVHPVRAMMMVGNMIMNGVFDKYPDLDIALIEGGIGWVPFVGNRLDDVYHNHPEDVRITERLNDLGQDYLQRKPSEYLLDHFSFSTQPIAPPKKPRNFAAVLDMLNAKENLMFATDYPHYTLELSNWAFENSAIDDELREQILHKNAERVFRL